MAISDATTPCSALTDRQETGPITAGTVRRMSSLNLDDFTDLIERPDGGVRRDAEARRERQVVPPGALGRLDDLGEWLAAAQSAVPVRAIERPRVVLFAGDHGVAGLGVSARPAGSADELVRSVLDGASPVSVLARRLGVPVRVVDMALDCEPESLPDEVVRHRVRRGSGRIDVEDALTLEEAEAAFLAGVAVADEEADSGTDLVVLGDVSVGGTTAAAVLIAALCGTDASVVTGRGGGPSTTSPGCGSVRRFATLCVALGRFSGISCSCSLRWAGRILPRSPGSCCRVRRGRRR